MTLCMPLREGITLPPNNVAISGANVHDALYATVESESARNERVGTLYSRVLPPGQTQVTAMLAQQPTLVSVELAANDVLPAASGRAAAMTPYATWQADYDQVIAAVQSTGARGSSSTSGRTSSRSGSRSASTATSARTTSSSRATC